MWAIYAMWAIYMCMWAIHWNEKETHTHKNTHSVSLWEIKAYYQSLFSVCCGCIYIYGCSFTSFELSLDVNFLQINFTYFFSPQNKNLRKPHHVMINCRSTPKVRFLGNGNFFFSYVMTIVNFLNNIITIPHLGINFEYPMAFMLGVQIHI